jgi:hypothetical protein
LNGISSKNLLGPGSERYTIFSLQFGNAAVYLSMTFACSSSCYHFYGPNLQRMFSFLQPIRYCTYLRLNYTAENPPYFSIKYTPSLTFWAEVYDVNVDVVQVVRLLQPLLLLLRLVPDVLHDYGRVLLVQH